MNKEKLLQAIKEKAKEVCNKKYIVRMPLYRKQKRDEIDRQDAVQYIIWNFDFDNQYLLKTLLTPEERKETKQYFPKELQ